MARSNPLDSLRRSGAPFSLGLLVLLVAFFLVLFLSSGGGSLVRRLVFDPEHWGAQPWTALTYALVNLSPMGLLFIGFGLYYFGAGLERDWGTRRFAGAFLWLTVLTPLFFYLGSKFTEHPGLLLTMVVPAACCVVGWAVRYPRTQIRLWCVLPIEARWVGWFTAIAVPIGFSWGYPLFVAFAGAPFLLTYLYAAGQLRVPAFPMPQRRSRGAREGDYEGLNWEKRREAEAERRRLKELFERSWDETEDGEGEQRSS
ncbi:MAG: rhomboid family intramembrane serine protease [Armatimonadetes bacterium]|nr:rhomboid family intramembrane serine protease [Armatimonadota bacterium]